MLTGSPISPTAATHRAPTPLDPWDIERPERAHCVAVRSGTAALSYGELDRLVDERGRRHGSGRRCEVLTPRRYPHLLDHVGAIGSLVASLVVGIAVWQCWERSIRPRLPQWSNS